MSIDTTTQSGEGWSPSPSFWQYRSVAVTGGTGFVGSHVVATLLDLGANVVVLVRDHVPRTPITNAWWPHVTVVRGSVEEQRVVERLLVEYEIATALHLAGQSQVQVAYNNPVGTFESNIRGSLSVLEAARRAQHLGQLVLVGSDMAYGTQPSLPHTEEMPLLAVNPYDVSMACADMIAVSYARTYGVAVSVVRCGNLFGPGDTNWQRLIPGTIRGLLSGQRPIIRSDGTLTRDFLYVIDAVLGYLQLAEAMAERPELAGEAFNLSAERPLTALELVEMLQIAAGTQLKPDIRGTASHEIERQYLSAAKARHVLGWSPGHTVEEALILTVRWYRDYLSGLRRSTEPVG